ncbi:hypothetical protein ACRALDRAFT_2028444 [Sodiomyces alcalophilus JCM 7366]|uniref:uncharacterized protein n=1 Tax=Sodiomyces alcalophilus JCM 7366 TaxID=591952 RepID=UPI0039B5ADBA
MAGTPAPKFSGKDPPLPPGFVSAQDILEGPVRPGQFVNFIGLVKDCRLPVPTSGTDYKCSLTLYDLSTENMGSDLVLNIFRPQPMMPEVGAGDVIVMLSTKVQQYRNDSQLSLITNKQTKIQIYEATKIPHYPKSARTALKPDKSHSSKEPSPVVEQYASWLYHRIDKDCVPDAAEFQERANQSINIKKKFSLLQDVRQDMFYDLIVQVAKAPFDLGDKVTVWVTDYTENTTFFHFALGGGDLSGLHQGQQEDPTGIRSELYDGFTGPFGKRCMQITCYEPHAAVIRSQACKGTFVRLRNVQVKYGSNGSNLEGFLREDRDLSVAKVQIDILDPKESSENTSPKLKDLLRRKRSYEKERKSQLKELHAEARGKKRQATSHPGSKPNAKQRRAQAREHARKKMQEEQDSNDEALLGLNDHVKCEHTDQPVTPLSVILERHIYRTTSHGVSIDCQLPFTCARYRVNVRVVDFFPPRLEDFACPRRVSEYEALSDYSSSSSSSEDDDMSMSDEFGRERVWEWRFALCLEQASHPSAKRPPENLWAIVTNADAQLLTGLDACDLRSRQDTLASLRERMFTLWGNLEEVKAVKSKERRKRGGVAAPIDRPPLDSSDAEAGTRTNVRRVGDGTLQSDTGRAVSNRPFSCCIQQYGIKVDEPNPTNANAGEGKRWERVFALFGTKVAYI